MHGNNRLRRCSDQRGELVEKLQGGLRLGWSRRMSVCHGCLRCVETGGIVRRPEQLTGWLGGPLPDVRRVTARGDRTRPPSQDRQAIACACGAAAPSSRWRGEGRGEGFLRRLRSAEPPAHPDIARRPAKFRTSPRKRWIGERGRRLAFFPRVPQNAIGPTYAPRTEERR